MTSSAQPYYYNISKVSLTKRTLKPKNLFIKIERHFKTHLKTKRANNSFSNPPYLKRDARNCLLTIITRTKEAPLINNKTRTNKSLHSRSGQPKKEKAQTAVVEKRRHARPNKKNA